METDDDDNNLEEFGQVADDRLPNVSQRVPYVANDGVSEGLGFREDREHEGYSDEYRQEDDEQSQQVEHEDDEDAEAMRVKQRVVLDADALDMAEQFKGDAEFPSAEEPQDAHDE